MISAMLQVGNLPATMTGDELRRLFEGAGNVLRVEVCQDKYGKAISGLVEMAREQDAKMAIQYLNGADVDGSKMTVAFPAVDERQTKESAVLQTESTPRPLDQPKAPQ